MKYFHSIRYVILSSKVAVFGIAIVLLFSNQPTVFAQQITQNQVDEKNGIAVQQVAQNETDEEDDVEEVQEVVVSASRVPVESQEIGSSVTVIDSEDIENRQSTFVHQLLRQVPSVAVSQSGPLSGKADVRIRGSEANQTLVLFDGIKLSDPASEGAFNISHLQAVGIDKIEVLRGPQSSIHGSDAVGGVVSISTKTPGADSMNSVVLETGSRSTHRLMTTLNNANDRSFFSLTAGLVETDGESVRVDNEETDEFENQVFHLKAGTQLSDRLSISTTAMQSESETDYDNCSWPPTQDCVENYKLTALGFNLNFKQLEGTLTHSISASSTKHVSHDGEDGSNSLRGIGKTEKFDYQVALNSQLETSEHTTVLAAESETQKVESAKNHANDGGVVKYKSYTLENRANFMDRVFVSAGVRFDDNSANNFRNATTYRLTLAGLVNDSVRVHSSYGTGVNNPTLAELYGWQDEWVGNPDLRPESNKAWDLGLETTFGTRNTRMDVTYFENRASNSIGFRCGQNCEDNDQTDFSTYLNDVRMSHNEPGVNTTKGWELSINSEFGDGYTLSANMTLSRGFKADPTQLLRRPSKIIGLNLVRQGSMFNRSGVLNLNIQHTGKQSDYTPWPIVSDLNSFTLVNLSTEVSFNENTTLTARANNLFDKEYQEIYEYQGAGRAYFIGTKFQF